MCNHARSPSSTLRRPTFYYSPGRISPEPSLESTNNSFHGYEDEDEESTPRMMPQLHGSFVEDDENDSFVARVTSHVANKRARSYCFLGLLELGKTTDQVDLLSTQFSLLTPAKGTGTPTSSTCISDVVTDCDSIEEDSSPRKRHCRGLIRSPRSSQLHSLGSLSD